MPIFNLTIPDSSPLITYAGVWNDSNVFPSENAYGHSRGSYRTTNLPGASCSFSFFGTGVYVFGARRPGYSGWITQLDNETGGGDPSPLGSDVTVGFPLIARSGLPSTQHNFTLTNAPNETGVGGMDIDYAVVEIGDGNTSTKTHSFIIDDTDDSFSYDLYWSPEPHDNQFLAQYNNNTFHSSSTGGSRVTITFKGVGIVLYGAVGTNHGLYSVSLDGSPPTFFNGTSSHFRAQMPLYLAGGLSLRQHIIVVTNLDDGKFTSIDYVDVMRYGIGSDSQANATSSGTSPSVTAASPSSPTHKIPEGVIAVTLLGALIFLALFGFLVLFRFRPRRVSTMGRKPSDFSLEGEPESPHTATMMQPHPFRAWSFIPVSVRGRNKLDEAMAQGWTRVPCDTNVASGSSSKRLPTRWFRHEEEVDMPPPNYARVFPEGHLSASAVPIGGASRLAREPTLMSKDGKRKVAKR